MSYESQRNSQGLPLEHELRAAYAQSTESFLVFADILGPSFQAGWHQLEKDGWFVVFPTYGGTKYCKEFKITSTPDDWLKSIDSLNRLLLAYFISDYEPRKIHSFEMVDNREIEKRIQLFSVFGNHQKASSINSETAKSSFNMSGWIFNGWAGDPNTQIEDVLIDKWYRILDNKTLFTSISLLQESFILTNKQFNGMNYYSYIDFSIGIMLLVAALENLFTNKQENHADIRFKFCVIGSLYYQKNVTDDFLRKFHNGADDGKFNQGDFRQILKELYDLRSDIAHGSYSKILRGKNWKNILALLKVHYDESFNQAILSKQVAMALGILQKHILALIIQSEIDLLKGAEIIDEAIIEKKDINSSKS